MTPDPKKGVTWGKVDPRGTQKREKGWGTT